MLPAGCQLHDAEGKLMTIDNAMRNQIQILTHVAGTKRMHQTSQLAHSAEASQTTAAGTRLQP